MAIKKIKLPGMAQPVDIGTTWANVSDKPDLVTSEEATAYMQKGVDYVTAGKKSGTTLGTKATAEGNNTTASGPQSHAEGRGTTASGSASHAEGNYATASGQYSHAEGNNTTASGYYSHAEGQSTIASGYESHTEGYITTASGDSSHAEGMGTTANHKSQHVFGEYNIVDHSSATASNKGNYVEIVGNGTAENARSNARTLDWSGNEILAGKLTVGAAPTGNMDVATKQYVDNILATNDAMIFKGTIGTNGTITTLPATHEAGWTYKVITAGSFAGQTCEVSDMIVCIADGETATDGDWIVVQTNVDGAVIGPVSSTAGHIATFTGTTGKAIQDSGFTIATSVPANAVFTDTTYENKIAENGGADVSLVSTGDKYNWNNKYTKPSTGIPATDLTDDIQISLGKANTALQEHQSLMAYRTSAAQDAIDNSQNTTIAGKASIDVWRLG